MPLALICGPWSGVLHALPDGCGSKFKARNDATCGQVQGDPRPFFSKCDFSRSVTLRTHFCWLKMILSMKRVQICNVNFFILRVVFTSTLRTHFRRLKMILSVRRVQIFNECLFLHLVFTSTVKKCTHAFRNVHVHCVCGILERHFTCVCSEFTLQI